MIDGIGLAVTVQCRETSSSSMSVLSAIFLVKTGAHSFSVQMTITLRENEFLGADLAAACPQHIGEKRASKLVLLFHIHVRLCTHIIIFLCYELKIII